jgi:hypothetical protein
MMEAIIRQRFDELWRWKCELPEKPPLPSSVENVRNIFDHWMPFLRQQFNRLFIGGWRYGLMCQEGKPEYDRVESIIKRLRMYQETGNKEHLVDCANLCALEYIECKHPKAHFHAVDDGEHVRVK